MTPQARHLPRKTISGLGSRARPEAWSDWLFTHPAVRRPSEIRYYDHHFPSVEAASAGLEVAISPLVLASDDVAKGRLLAPAGFDPDGSHYGLIWTGEAELGDQAGRLAAWLREECRQSFG